MKKSIDQTRLNQGRTRREALGLLSGSAAMLGIALAPGAALAQGGEETVLTEALALAGPDLPVAGNPNSALSSAEWFGYKCPDFRKRDSDVRQMVPEDSKVRLVLTDWPILG